MAVYTKVSDADLKQFLFSYDVGALKSSKGIEQGVSNTNYFVTTDRSRYVLTLFEPHRVRAEDISFFLDYAITLEKAGIPCPETILRKDGAALSSLNERPAVLFSVLEGEGGSVGMLTPSLCEQAGAMLARMHNAAKSIDARAANQFSLARWREWVDRIGSRMDVIKPGIYDLARTELETIEAAWPENLPEGAIHADYFPDNVFFKDNAITGIIDFHFVCTDAFAYDLAIALNAWSFDPANEFQPDRMEAMMRGYRSVRPLSEAEEKAMPILRRAAALRFLLSRVEEKLKWTPGDFMVPHDPLVFARRIEHFQGMAS